MDIDEIYYIKSKFEVPYYIVTKIRILFVILYFIDEIWAYQNRYSLWEALTARALYLTEWGYFLTGLYFIFIAFDNADYRLTTRYSTLFTIVFTS